MPAGIPDNSGGAPHVREVVPAAQAVRVTAETSLLEDAATQVGFAVTQVNEIVDGVAALLACLIH